MDTVLGAVEIFFGQRYLSLPRKKWHVRLCVWPICVNDKLVQRFGHLQFEAKYFSNLNYNTRKYRTLSYPSRTSRLSIQEAQLPQRNSASAAHIEGAKPSSPLPLWLHLCVWSNSKPATNVRQACRPPSAL